MYCYVDGVWNAAVTHVFNTDGIGRYWRLYITAVATGGDRGAADLELFTSSGGADQCTEGTPSASSVQVAYVAANAFDNNDATSWLSGTPGTVPQWIKHDFGSGVTKDIIEVGITAPASSGADLAPLDFQVQ